MNIKKVVVGQLQENCYVLNINNDYLLIDPGDEANKIIKEIKGNLLGILITHSHQDHIGALNDILDYKKVPIYNYLNKNQDITISNFNFKVIDFPGHKEDLVGFLFNNKLFSGDFIFKGTIGRIDLPGGNFKEMQKSIAKVLSYNKDLIIYPGHGDITTLSEEKENLKLFL